MSRNAIPAAWMGAAASAVIFLAGCGGAYDATVQGVVTLDGNRVTRGTVAYAPVAGGPAAYARIDENGNYMVQTGRETGLPSGEYQVTVTSTEVAVPSTDGGPPPPGRPITPLWYRSKDTSGLKFNVERGSNTIDLELTSQPPAGWKPRGR